MLTEYLTKLCSNPQKVRLILNEPPSGESKRVILMWFDLLPESHQEALVDSPPNRMEGEEADCYLKRIKFRRIVRQKYGLGLND